MIARTGKKNGIIIGLCLDGAVSLFLFITSIVMIAKSAGLRPEQIETLPAGFINNLIKNPTVFLWAFVIPLFVLLIVNIVLLVFYIKKSNKKQETTIDDLSAEQIEELKKELLSDIVDKKEQK